MTVPPESAHLTRLTAALAHRYAIEREIGRGGMATVYLAEDTKHRRKVAVKVIQPEIALALGRERFLREIDIAATLNHPHILPLHDSGDVDGFLFYVMPYVSGPSLRQKLRTEGPLPLDEALRITGQIASALGHAHARALIHRDIKPENILIHEGEAMVTDFGIARAVSAAAGATLTTREALTTPGMVVGTVSYMSPEQAMGASEVDARSDVYSLGCVVYEMLVGEPPFTGASAAAIIGKQMTGEAPRVGDRRSDVPATVDRAILNALARIPADRFASVTAFSAQLLPAPAAPTSDPSVAVLPFLNLSSDAENEYFADGITEDVIAQLCKMPALKVISRTSVMPFKKREQSLRQIAATLGVTTVVEGSVRRSGERVRIVAQLIDAQTDQHLWADTYDRHLTDIFAIQSDVALHIATALEAELSPEAQARIQRKPTSDLEAYQLYLQGRHCLVRYTGEGMRKAISFFEQAIARDKDYALAYAGIASACAELAESGHLKPQKALRRGREAAEFALILDGELGEAHCVLGQLTVLSDFDWTGAEKAFKRALELSPGSADTYAAYARMCGALERYDEAMVMGQRAHELDPLAHRADVANTLLRAGRHEEALRVALQVVAFDPHYDRAHATLGWAYLKSGRPDEGVAELEQAVALSAQSPNWLAQLGEAYALVGRSEEARQVLQRLDALALETYVSPYHRAYVHTGLGELDAAIDWLERAYEERAGAVNGIKGSFLFQPLRPHPRFQALLRKMNLADSSG
ncbi:MAG: protein kinase [Vicinamibacterales bacterium]